jgi:hypothetical protein
MGHRRNVISPPFWRNNIRGNGNGRGNGKGKRSDQGHRFYFESLEPRILLSGDLSTIGVSEAIYEGIGKFGVVVNDFILQEPLLDVQLPIVVSSSGDNLLNYETIAPTIEELLRVNADADGDGSGESGLYDPDLDRNNDLVLDFSDLFLTKFIDEIRGYLNDPQDLDVDGDIDSDDFLAFLIDPARNEAGSFSSEEYADRSWSLNVDAAQNISSDHEVAFQLDLTLVFTNEMALDLGYQAEDLGIVPEATLDVEAAVSFTLQFGVMTSGEEATDSDFFVSIPEPMSIEVTLQDSSLDGEVNIGFLGADFNNGSVTLEANIDATFTDPTNLDSRISYSDLSDYPVSSLIEAEPRGVTFDGSDPAIVKDSVSPYTKNLVITISDNILQVGDLVVYSNGGGESIGNLIDGSIYSVMRVEGDSASSEIQLMNTGESSTQVKFESAGTGSNHRLILSRFDIDLPVEVKEGLAGFEPSDAISFKTPTHNPFEASTAIVEEDGNMEDLFQVRERDKRFNFGIDLEQDLLNFTNMDASSIIGLFREFGRYLDGLGDSGDFTSFGIPFAMADLGDVMDFRDMWDDGVLYDDGDDGIDGPDKLVVDFNAALANGVLTSDTEKSVDLTGRIIATADGTNITLAAIDPDIQSFDVSVTSGAADLGLATGSNPSSGGSFPFLTFVPNDVTLSGGKAEFSITIVTGAGIEEAVTVDILPDDTSDNTGVGNDSAGIIDAGNAPLFATAQELAEQLARVLYPTQDNPIQTREEQLAHINAAYNTGTADLTYNINLENTLPFLEAQTDFNLLLEPLDNISSDSKVLLGGSAGLDMVLGINLLDSISSDYLQDTTTLEEIEVEIKSEPAVTGENNVRTIYGRLTEDATFDVIIDADTYEVTVHVADAGLLGFDNGQEADGTITAARDASDFSPGSDITFELTVGTDDPYIIKLPTTGISGTDDNLNLDDLVADLNAALSGALAADGMTIDLRADVEAGTDPSGTKLTLAHLGDSNTSLGIKSLGAMSDNERTTMADGVLDLVKDIELALTNARLIGTNDTDPRSRVDLTNIITVTNEEGRLKLSSESDFTVTVDSGDPAMNKLGFRSEHQAEPDDPDNPAPPYSLTSTKDAPRLVGRLTDDAIFTIEFGGVEYTVTVEAGDAEANQTVLDLVNDLNFALSNPSMVSDTVSDFTLDSAATFQVSINGGSFVDVIVQPEATNGTSAPIPFNGDTDVDPDDDTITLTGHNLETGESLIYRNNGGNNIAGLNDGETYYVFVVDSDTVRLAVGEMEALSGETVDLLDSDSAGDHQLEETLNVDIEDLVQDINRAIAATDVDGIRLDKYIVAESYVWGEESRIRIKAVNNHDDPVLGFELTVEPDDPAETFLGLPNSQLCGNLEGLIEAGSQGNHLVLTSLNGSGFTIDAASAAELGLSTSQTSDSDDLVIHLSDGNDYRVDLDGAVTVADVMVAITEQTSLENLSEAELGFDPTQDAAAAGSDLVIAAVNPETVDASSGLSGDAFFTLSVTRGESNEVAEVVVPKGSGTGGTLVSDITEALEKAGFEGGFTIGRDSSGHITLTAADATITAFSLMSLGPVKVQINDEKKGTGLKLIDRTWFESDSDILFFVEPTNSSPAATQLGITRIDVTRDGNEDGDVNNLDADGVIDGAPIKGPDLADRFFVENAEVRGEFLLMTPQTDDDGIFRDTDNDDDLWDGIDASAALGYLGVSLHGGGMLSGEVQSTLDNAGTKGIDAITNTRPTVTGTAADGTFGQLILDVTATPPLSIENMDHPDDSRIALTVTSMGDPFDEHVLPDPVKSGADTLELKGDHTDLLVKGAAVTIGLDESSTFTDTIDGLDQKAADSFTLDGDQTGLISSGSKVLFDNNATRVKGAIYDDIEKTTTVTIVDAVLPAVLSEVTVWRSLLAEVLGSSYDPDEDTTTVTFRTDAIAGVAIGTLDADAHFTIETGGIEYNVTVEAWQTAENSTVLDLVDDINQALAQPSLVSDPLAGFVLSGPADFSVSVNGGSPVSVVIMPEHTDGTGAPVNFNGDTDVDPESDTIAIGSNGFVTGEKVIYSSNNGTVIHGLEEGQIYFVIVEDANSIKLASTRRNALYESAVDIIAGGSVGEHRLTEAPNDGDDIEDLVLDINAAIRGTDLDGLIVAESYVQGEDSRIRIKAIDDAVDRFRLEAVPGNALSLPESPPGPDIQRRRGFCGNGPCRQRAWIRPPPNVRQQRWNCHCYSGKGTGPIPGGGSGRHPACNFSDDAGTQRCQRPGRPALFR